MFRCHASVLLYKLLSETRTVLRVICQSGATRLARLPLVTSGCILIDQGICHENIIFGISRHVFLDTISKKTKSLKKKNVRPSKKNSGAAFETNSGTASKKNSGQIQYSYMEIHVFKNIEFFTWVLNKTTIRITSCRGHDR